MTATRLSSPAAEIRLPGTAPEVVRRVTGEDWARAPLEPPREPCLGQQPLEGARPPGD